MLRIKGVIPPEKIGMDDELFKRFLEELKNRGVNVVEEAG